MGGESKLPRKALAALAVIGAMLVAAVAASGASAARTQVHWIHGYKSPGTPNSLNMVGLLRFGPSHAPNILILNPGTSAGSAYFAPLARAIVKRTPGWQVWSVERRENLLEDQSVFNRAKRGKATPEQVFDYYLKWVTDHTITHHVQPVPDSDVQFAKQWGMNTEIHDLRKVVRLAKEKGRHVVVGGHSLGGSITTAYATWDFNGKPGVKGLSGLVFIDGASGPDPVSKADAQQSLDDLNSGSSPWLAFGGIPAPFAGLFGDGGSSAAKMAPNAPSLAQDWSGLPSYLKPPVPADNEAQFGFASDVKTSPSSLAAFQVHAGHLQGGNCDPCGWIRGNAITPIQRYATMISGWGLQNVDGTAWYHPMRLSIDSGAVADGNANPAQKVLDVDTTHGNDINVPMYAFAAALGNDRVVQATKALARQSHLPKRDVTIVNKAKTYAHNDPNAASPSRNDFLKHLTPFLDGIGR
jgi:pimeloyl-ACP methyl ester carboxylesterase